MSSDKSDTEAPQNDESESYDNFDVDGDTPIAESVRDVAVATDSPGIDSNVLIIVLISLILILGAILSFVFSYSDVQQRTERNDIAQETNSQPQEPTAALQTNTVNSAENNSAENNNAENNNAEKQWDATTEQAPGENVTRVIIGGKPMDIQLPRTEK